MMIQPIDPNLNIVKDGLQYWFDARFQTSYPASGTTLYDISGNDYDGTLVGGVGYSSTDGGSLTFNGGTQYVTLGLPANLNGHQVPLTMCFWAKQNNLTGNNTLWGIYEATSAGRIYSLFRTTSTKLEYYASNSSCSFQFKGTLTPSANVWNFYAVTVAGTTSSPTVTIYLNGSSQTFSYGALCSSIDTTVDFRIGAVSTGTYTESWDGNIASAMWYNRALSSDEIAHNYNTTKGRFI